MAALSFIGLGIQPPQSEWGVMTAEGASQIVTGEWWLFLFPGLAIMITVLAFKSSAWSASRGRESRSPAARDPAPDPLPRRVKSGTIRLTASTLGTLSEEEMRRDLARRSR
ncbi:MAG: hypothetical protein IPO58_05985 [Betaproteobacteria bacterium]|nr:hypothetical protein [Betaproteobacteria bacterium]